MDIGELVNVVESLGLDSEDMEDILNELPEDLFDEIEESEIPAFI